MVLKTPRGMLDLLPEQTNYWQQVENIMIDVLQSYGFLSVRTPIIEHQNIFIRAIGDNTDIISKEMYSFKDRNNDILSLRPENTAGCVRMFIEHSLLRQNIQKIWYLGPMFRRERPQKGRYRQFHQLGAEIYGIEGYSADVELIMLTNDFWQKLGISDYVSLEINSLGIDKKLYLKSLNDYFSKFYDTLDEDSKKTIKNNLLRILDSKNEKVQSLIIDAPKMTDYLTDKAKTYFDSLKHYLDSMNIRYTINPYLVRGLDYYDGIVFEWKTKYLGSQSAICGGGRYDNLFHQFGEESTNATGFSIGMERLILLLQQKNQNFIDNKLKLYVVSFGKNAKLEAFKISDKLRKELQPVIVINDITENSVKKQFKKANKNLAQYVIIIMDDEIKSNKISIKCLTEGWQKEMTFLQLISFLKQEKYEKSI